MTKKQEQITMNCPYCQGHYKITPKKDEDTYVCKECNKEFKAILGFVISAQGTSGYVARQAVIRFRGAISGKTLEMNYYSTHQGLSVHKGDPITIYFKKGWHDRVTTDRHFKYGYLEARVFISSGGGYQKVGFFSQDRLPLNGILFD